MTKTFKDEFDEIINFIEKKGMAVPFDNTMGLVNLDRMVDIVIPTPELQADIHKYLRGVLQEMMAVEYSDKVDKTLIGYV